ncbi:MAG: succinylglutamate desuccinylase/aspartoacylase family protein [Cardiobacteriaceae bacterium]|nr:succinylglutamate desuccinylase/aspartoacylase family protein [Cardiobacteriaceae bacterium]
MHHQTLSLPSGILGTQSQIEVYRFGEQGARPKIYLQAALHADEWTGTFVLVKLIEHLKSLETAGKIVGEVVVVPLCNPVGMRQFLGGFQLGRFDFDYTGNFNRGYPDLAALALPQLDAKALSILPHAEQIAQIRATLQSALNHWQVELEADFVRKALFELALDADFVLDCHCDAQACLHAFANVYHENTAKALCNHLGAEVLLLEESTGVIAFDEALAGIWWKLAKALSLPQIAQTCFATTLEFRGERDVGINSERDVEGLLNFMREIRIINETAPAPHESVTAYSLNHVARILAPQSALVEFLVKTGEEIQTGQALCHLHLINQLHTTQSALTLYAPCSGKVYALGRNHLVKRGHVLVQIASHHHQGTGTLTF